MIFLFYISGFLNRVNRTQQKIPSASKIKINGPNSETKRFGRTEQPRFSSESHQEEARFEFTACLTTPQHKQTIKERRWQRSTDQPTTTVGPMHYNSHRLAHTQRHALILAINVSPSYSWAPYRARHIMAIAKKHFDS